MSDADEQLQHRLRRPQRHRLLQGFPAVPAMIAAVPEPPSPWPDNAVVRGLDGGLRDGDFDFAAAELAKPPFFFDDSTGTADDRARMSAAREGQLSNRADWQRTVDNGSRAESPFLRIDSTRGLIVGVIPHTQCIPRQEACGFCTFPHDVANARSRATMIEAVNDELHMVCSIEGIAGRRVDARRVDARGGDLRCPWYSAQRAWGH